MENDVSIEEVETYSRQELVCRLIAVGVNSSHGSYGEEQKKLFEGFMNLPLIDVAPMWPFLNERVQVILLKAHHEEFMKWINSVGSPSSPKRVPDISLVK